MFLRGLAEGTVDPFPFFLARDLGLTLEEIEAMPYGTYQRWLAFYQWEQWHNTPGKEVSRGSRH